MLELDVHCRKPWWQPLAPFLYQAPASREAVVFHDHMRKLWEDHIMWTRSAVVSFAAETPDLEAITQRLLHNQDDIAAALRPYFGEIATTRLATLLKEHIQGAVSVLVAAKTGNPQTLEVAVEAWYANGVEVADFLFAANPEYWPKQVMRQMMREHLDTTLVEATERLAGNFNADIAAYEEVHRHILKMADALSCGVISRFPGKFGMKSCPKDNALCPAH